MNIQEIEDVISKDAAIILADAEKAMGTLRTLFALVGPFLPAAQRAIAAEGFAVADAIIAATPDLSKSLNAVLEDIRKIIAAMQTPQ